MAEPGYVYVMINYSMPGVVKIGRTARSPERRAAELSAATGVPQPFIVAYDVLLPDAIAGEAALHQRLAGGRVTRGREFFDTPLREVIRAMLLIRDQMTSGTVSSTQPSASAPPDRDELFGASAEACMRYGNAGPELLRAHFGIDYARAARIVDQLEQARVLGPADEQGTHKVLLSFADLRTRTGRTE